MTQILGFWPVAAMLLLPGLAYAQQPGELPSAASIFKRYIAVTGGQAAYDRVENETRVVTVRHDGQVVSQITSIQARNGNFRMATRSGEQIEEIGLNGGVAWRKKQDTADLLEGDERDGVLGSAVLLPDSQWERYFSEAETIDTDTVDGRVCYVIEAVPFAGPPQALWYDHETGLLVKQVVAGPEDDSEVTFVFKEYSGIDGLRTPRSVLMAVKGVSFDATVDSIEFNQSLPASAFDLPPEVARLMKRRSAQ